MPAMAAESDFPFDYYHYNTGDAPGATDSTYIYADDYGFGWGSGLYADDYMTLNSSVDGWVTVQIIGSTGFNGEIRLYENVSYSTGDDFWIHNNSMWADTDSIGISNITQLQFIDNFVTHDYHLLNDINATETISWNGGDGFEPIGTSVLNPYSGTFDMMGYTISDITIDRQTEDRVAMFSRLSGTVKNGTVSGAYIQGKQWTACIASVLSGTVENINTVDGVVLGYGVFTGGITAQPAAGAMIYQCYNSNTIGSSHSYVGGIVGSMSEGTIDQCVNKGNITGTSTFVGGITGALVNSAEMIDTYNSGYVTATSDYAGGLTAYAADSTIINSYSTGPVNSGTNHGGAVGVQSNSVATSVYWNTETSGRSTSALGTGKTTNEMLVRSTYSGWDFANTWEAFGSYPVLQFEGIDGYSVDPYIISPEDGTTTNTSYPPLETAILFSWASHDNADSSTYTIARDSNFNTIVTSGTITTFSRSVNLPGGDYWFRVKYNFDDGSSSNYSTAQFTINSTSVDYGTAVQGVVYQSLSGSQTPLSGALVRIYNDTWSGDNYVTSSNGFYLFNSDLTNSTYYIIATKDGYTDNTFNIVTLQSNTTTTKNIVLERETAPTYIYPHYVLFTVKSVFGGVYSDVTVNVYEGDSATAIYTGITGDDGAVGFELSETIRYRLTLYSEEHDIDTTYRVTPTKNSYNIYVSLYSTEPTQQDDGVILYGVHTDGDELNVTWDDTSGMTSLVQLWINNTDGSNAYYLTSTDSDSSLTQEVNTTANLTYVVKLQIESSGLENTFIRTHVVNFEEGVKTAFNIGFTESWQSMFLAALSIIFIAVLFGSANAHVGAIMVSIAGIFHVFITGWIPGTPLTIVMMFIALIVSGLFYMRKGEAVR